MRSSSASRLFRTLTLGFIGGATAFSLSFAPAWAAQAPEDPARERASVSQSLPAAETPAVELDRGTFNVVVIEKPKPAPEPAPELAVRSSASDDEQEVTETRSYPSAPSNPEGAQAIAAEQVAARGWGNEQLGCLVDLWNKESGWNVNAHNSSGAHGIPQALPGSKMASAGADWETNPATQISWGLGYIDGRYGTPCGAWDHSRSVGWY